VFQCPLSRPCPWLKHWSECSRHCYRGTSHMIWGPEGDCSVGSWGTNSPEDTGQLLTLLSLGFLI
jgi:hypothetical protein